MKRLLSAVAIALLLTRLLPIWTPVWAAVALGQHLVAHAIAGTVTSGALTTSATGSVFVVCVATDGTINTPTDSKTNTYTALGADLVGGAFHSRCYYVENGTGGASHTFSETSTGGSTVTLFAVEITGAATSGALDQTNRQTDAATPFTSPAVTTTQANEFLLGWIVSEGSSGIYNHTAGNSFTGLDEETDGNDYFPGLSMYQIVSATASYNTSVTVATTTPSNTGNWIMTFKEAGGGGGSPAPKRLTLLGVGEW